MDLPTSEATTENSFYSDDGSLNWKKIGMIFLIVFLVLILALIIVHYTITPIFKLKQGAPGYVPVPGMVKNDGYLYWKSPIHDDLQESTTILKGDKGDMAVTFQMDILLSNINFNLNNDTIRPVFMRYSLATDPNSGSNYSVGAFLEPHVNDLLIQVRTQNRDVEVVRVRNVPGKQPFRIGIVLAINYFEVYYNGRLVGTRNLKNPPLQSVGYLFGSPGSRPGNIDSSTGQVANCPTSLSQQFKSIKNTACTSQGNVGGEDYGGIMNLYIWQRILTADEMRYSGPAMPSVDDFKRAAKGGSKFLNLL